MFVLPAGMRPLSAYGPLTVICDQLLTLLKLYELIKQIKPMNNIYFKFMISLYLLYIFK